MDVIDKVLLSTRLVVTALELTVTVLAPDTVIAGGKVRVRGERGVALSNVMFQVYTAAEFMLVLLTETVFMVANCREEGIRISRASWAGQIIFN